MILTPRSSSMTSTTSHPQLGDEVESTSKPKKRRTTDADWEEHKPEMIHLYVVGKKSRHEMREIMKEKYGRTVTPKQLKHLFEKKWKVSKNKSRIPRPMLQRTTGQLADVHHLPTGEILTNQSLPLSAQGEASTSSSGLVLSMPRETIAATLGAPPQTATAGLLTMVQRGNDVPTYYQAFGPENVPADSLEDDIMPQWALGRSTTFSETFHDSLAGFQLSSTVTMRNQEREETFSGVFDTLTGFSRTSIPPRASFTSKEKLQEPLQCQSTLEITRRSSPKSIREACGKMSHSGIWPIAAFRRQSDATVSCRLDLVSTCCPEMDPETIILPLQAIQKRVLKGFSLRDPKYYSRADHKVRKALSSDWVLDALRVVLRWAYRGAEKKIAGQQRQWHAGKADAPEDDQLLCMSTEDTDRSFVRKADGMLEIRPRIFNSDGDVFRAGLYRAFDGGENDCREATEMIAVSLIPSLRWHGSGISITIHRALDLRFGTCIPPSIRAFNVVPWDAEIIRLVEKNDLRGVRELFETRKASPTDVNPDGHSLLSYAIYPGAAELFELLLRGGADVWHCCNAWGNTIDLISAIWQRWSIFRFHRLCARTTDEDCFDETAACIRLTNIAFDHGCEIDLCTSGDLHSLSPLFEIAWRPCLKSAEYMEAIASLIGKGCDKDERNNTGQTPFLFAVVVPWSTATLLRVLVSYKVDLAAVDNFGRGAFHSAILHVSFQYRLQVLKENSEQENALRLSAFGSNNVGGQRLEDAVLTDDDKQPTAKDIDWHKWIDDLSRQDMLHNMYHGFIYWERIDEPRVYSTLLFLFEVGCDPNLKDRDGLVPSDYVRGLPIWSTWEKALTKSGWFYDARSKQCIKRIQTANEDVHEIEDESDLEIAQFAQVGRQNHTEEVLNDFDPPLEGWPLPDDCTTGHESLEFPNVFTLCSPMPGVEEI
ncbi:hypothetical protein EDD36DRAFT_134933 [Exophiala viscosa]|uniref:Clr5 domain-containing protein n=1 Tax=Exophiala viscosa TaxID=2486360 RepID=A0AAN6E1D0_9EURO|nr:hypothetical protein EDD36DRAFT_134933 [Exophiala viscosa]